MLLTSFNAPVIQPNKTFNIPAKLLNTPASTADLPTATECVDSLVTVSTANLTTATERVDSLVKKILSYINPPLPPVKCATPPSQCGKLPHQSTFLKKDARCIPDQIKPAPQYKDEAKDIARQIEYHLYIENHIRRIDFTYAPTNGLSTFELFELKECAKEMEIYVIKFYGLERAFFVGSVPNLKFEDFKKLSD